MKTRLTPFTIVLLYAVIGGLWILFSDMALKAIIADPALMIRVAIMKGWAYVLVTASMLYWLIRRYARERRKNEEKFVNVFERITDGFVALDNNWRYTYVNKKAGELFRRKPEDLIGRHIWTEFPEGVGQPFFKAYYKAIEEQSFIQLEEYYPPYDRWFENRIYPSKDGLSIFFQDITHRKTAEAALRKAKEFAETLIQTMNVVFVQLDSAGKVLRINEIAERITGYDQKEILGKNWFELLVPRDRYPHVWEEFGRIMQRNEINEIFENPILTKTGEERQIIWKNKQLYEGDRVVGTISFGVDITERKKAEEEIKIANKELLAINKIIVACSAVLDTKEILNKIMDEAIHITGLEGGTICLVGPDETLHLAAQRATSEATIRDLTTNAVKVGECLCGESARDHKPLILPDREAVLGFATREAMRGEDIRFHAAFPLIVKEKCLGVLCVFTRTDRKPSDRSLKLLETVTVQIALALENAQLHENTLRHAATLEDKVKERTAALQDSQRALMNIVEDLNQKTSELEQANGKLKDVDRLKSLFIASMSHELRTPLNSVIGFSSVLLNQWAGPINDEQKNLLATISRSGKHLLTLINDVIDVSKIEAGTVDIHVEDFDLCDVIGEVVELLKGELGEKKLELIVDSIHVEMHTDRRRLFQSVMNLVSNAVKFTIKGSISVKARRVMSSELGVGSLEQKQERLNPELHGNFVEISVEDTGIGIKEEDIPKLFKSFVRLDSPLRTTVLGTGLGLYLTKKLVTEILKGDIGVESTYDAGSKFAIRAPVKINE